MFSTVSCFGSLFWSFELFLGKVGPDKVKTVGHCELKCGITSLKVYGDKCLNGTIVFFNLQLWRQVKTKSLRVTSKMNHLEPSKLVQNK